MQETSGQVAVAQEDAHLGGASRARIAVGQGPGGRFGAPPGLEVYLQDFTSGAILAGPIWSGPGA